MRMPSKNDRCGTGGTLNIDTFKYININIQVNEGAGLLEHTHCW